MSARVQNANINEEELFRDAEDEIRLQDLVIHHSTAPVLEHKDVISEEESDGDDYEEYENDFAINNLTTNQQRNAATGKVALQPNEQLLRKYHNKINVEKYEGPLSLPGHAANLLREKQRLADNGRIRVKDKHDRATVEQVRIAHFVTVIF